MKTASGGQAEIQIHTPRTRETQIELHKIYDKFKEGKISQQEAYTQSRKTARTFVDEFDKSKGMVMSTEFTVAGRARTESLSFDEALKLLTNPVQGWYRAVVEAIDRKMNIESRAYNAIGATKTYGNENSVARVIYSDVPFETMKYVGAKSGLIGRQKTVIVFKAGQGETFLYSLVAKGKKMYDVYKELTDAGIEYMTLIPRGGDVRIFILDTEKSVALQNNVNAVAKRYGTKPEVQSGQGEFIGSFKEGSDADSRGSAAESYRRIILDYERGRTGQTGKVPGLQGRGSPVGRVGQEAERLHFVEEGGGALPPPGLPVLPVLPAFPSFPKKVLGEVTPETVPDVKTTIDPLKKLLAETPESVKAYSEGQRASKVAAKMIREGKLNPDQIPELKALKTKYLLDNTELADALEQFASLSGKGLNIFSQYAKGLSRELKKMGVEPMSPPPTLWDKLKVLPKNFVNVWRSSLVSQLATAMRNIETFGQRFFFDVLDEAMAGVAEVVIKGKKPSRAFAPMIEDIAAIGRKLTPSGRRRLADILETEPILEGKLFNTPVGDVTVGGSPRSTGSALSPKEAERIINRFIDKKAVV